MKYQQGKGATGALIATYEKAIISLQNLIKDINDKDLARIADPDTENPDCQSIQTILTHVVSAGFSYCIYIRNAKNKPDMRPEKVTRTTSAEYLKDLDQVMAFTADTFADIHDRELEQFDDRNKIHTWWGQVYDMEQLMEHAIVHILRHERQIARFKMLLHDAG